MAPRLALLDHPCVMAALATAIGGGMGLARADWQWAVEIAQTASGIVPHSPESVPAIVAASLWSVVTQALAVALRLGLSEAVLSMVLSAAGTGLAVLVLSILAYASSRRTMVAIGAALLVIEYGWTDASFNDGDVVYPIFIFPTPHTYGAIGLFTAMLAVGAIGLGWSRSGALLLGLLPSVHASIGVPVVAAATTAFVWQRLAGSEGSLKLRWFGGGLLLTLLSFALHTIASAGGPPSPPNAGAYLEVFVGFWDAHRHIIGWNSKGVLANIAVPIVAILVTWRPYARFSSDFGFLLRTLAIVGLLSVAIVTVQHATAGRLPAWLVAAMPARVLNVNVMAFAALLIGLLATLVLPGSSARKRPARLSAGATIVLTVVSLAAGTAAYKYMREHPDRLVDQFALPPKDVVFQAARRGEGILLTAGDLWLIQLRTRRPVLIDGGTLDTLPYALASAPRVDRILREIYNTSLFDPPPEARHSGRIPNERTRQAWESYSFDTWRHIGREWNVRQVLAYGDWRLELPTVVHSPAFVLYEIPR